MVFNFLICPGEDLHSTASLSTVLPYSFWVVQFFFLLIFKFLICPGEDLHSTATLSTVLPYSFWVVQFFFLLIFKFLICPGEDLNLHALRHVVLSHACLPIPPPGHTGVIYQWSLITFLRDPGFEPGTFGFTPMHRGTN